LPIPSDVWIDLLSQCCIQRWQVNNAMDIKHQLLALAETLTLNQSDWLYDWFNNQMGSSNEWQKFSWELSVQDILRNTQ